MTWAFLAAGTALFYALHGAWSTRVTRHVGPLLAGWALFAFAFPILLGYLAFRGMPEIGALFWPVWGVTSVLNLGAWYLFFSALRVGDLGIGYPLLALTPLLMVPIEWMVLGDSPGPTGAAGIALVVAGVYLLNFGERHRGILEPLRAIARDPGAVRMLGVALIWSVSGTLDRVAVLESSPAFYGAMLCGGLAALFLPFAVFARPAGKTGVSRHEATGGGNAEAQVSESVGFPERVRRAGPGALMLHGLLFALMLMLQFEALDLAFASYVLSIKRSGAVLAVVIGYLAFQERALGSRLAGAVVTVGGAAVLMLWG